MKNTIRNLIVVAMIVILVVAVVPVQAAHSPIPAGKTCRMPANTEFYAHIGAPLAPTGKFYQNMIGLTTGVNEGNFVEIKTGFTKPFTFPVFYDTALISCR